MRRAIILLSGGLDSITTLAIAKHEGFDCYALSFQYGQRHAHELDCAKIISDRMGVVEHLISNIDLRSIGGSALTADIDVPKERSPGEIGEGVPITYVPARNTIFLSFALAWAEVLGAWDIYIGVNALDYSGYPDCRPEYIAAFEKMANLATKSSLDNGIKIHTPLISMTKSEIIRTGLNLGVDYSITSSCYDPRDKAACGTCDSCLLRIKGFESLGITDPIKYKSKRR